VKTDNLAIGDSDGKVDMFHHTSHDYSSSILRSTNLCVELYPSTSEQATLSVAMRSLDAVVDSLRDPLEPEMLIKMDVQGYEDRVIRGGAQTFRGARACILEVSLDDLYENQATFKDLVVSLSDFGYRYAANLAQHYGSDGHAVYLDALFLRGL